ncbi:hypothetical protein Scep_015681 [Stephania cephalantha]|uniref:Prephenate dehydratase domain-containing protein n=1 Tax=Stephania cephalantha TaxID=152367 RepID=A0AAP0P314_9MAGN
MASSCSLKLAMAATTLRAGPSTTLRSDRNLYAHRAAVGVGLVELIERISASRCLPGMGIGGVPGAFSESAAAKAYPNCEAVPCEQFDTAFDAVERWLVDRAVLPIENSLGGSIHRNYDLLLRHSLHIVGEVRLSIRHCLLANQGVKLEDLKRVLSHPQALSQCENTLTKLGVVREAVDDTAGAAQYVALQQLKDAGAVASAGAAKIYGLNILAEDIQDDTDNITRFLILAREPIIPGIDRPFKIESRPRRKQPMRLLDDGSLKYFDYLFYVDFDASMADENAQNALRHLETLYCSTKCVHDTYYFDLLFTCQIHSFGAVTSTSIWTSIGLKSEGDDD